MPAERRMRMRDAADRGLISRDLPLWTRDLRNDGGSVLDVSAGGRGPCATGYASALSPDASAGGARPDWMGLFAQTINAAKKQVVSRAPVRTAMKDFTFAKRLMKASRGRKPRILLSIARGR